MSWRDGLNELQQKAIEAAECPGAIAGPGTGKTKTLLRKGVQLIEEHEIPATAIRLVNFTRAGIRDLKKKISEETEYSALDPSCAQTFHSLALRILRTAGPGFLPSPLVIMDQWEEELLLDRLVKQKLDMKDVRQARKLRQDYNSRWCLASESADEWHSKERRLEFEGVYNTINPILGFVTPGELTFLWWRYLRSTPGTSLTEVTFPWTHLLVDEYQDLNECEHEILEGLAKRSATVFAVGDPNQSIYETMRHAHPSYCWELPTKLGSADLEILEKSYRCPKSVLRMGAALLGDAPGVPSPELAQAEGEAHIIQFPSNDGEVSGISLLAEALLKQSPGTRVLVAVPVRTLAQPLVEALGERVTVEDRTAKAGDLELGCRLASALLRLLKEPRDSVAAATALVLNCAESPRNELVVDLLNACEEQSQKVADALEGKVSLPPRLEKARGAALEMLDRLKNTDHPLDELREMTGCEEIVGLSDDDNDDLEAGEPPEQLEPDRVTIMTLHAAKGTEAEWVILPAAEPGFLERDEVGVAREERRRLFYVGITRAIDGLFISYAARRYGPERYFDPTGDAARKGASTFIDEICDRTGIKPITGQNFLQERIGSETTTE